MITLFVLIGTLGLGCCALNPLDHALVHSHNIQKVDLTKEDISQTGRPVEELCQFAGPFGGLQFTDNALIPTEVIEFKLKLRSTETLFKVELFIKPHIEQRLVMTPWTHNMHFEIYYDERLRQVNISLPEDNVAVGFAVWDIMVNHKVSISPKQIQLRDESSWAPALTSDPLSGRQLYSVSSSSTGDRAYLNFTFDDPDSAKDYRFALFLSTTKTPIDVYVRLFGAKQAIRLTQLRQLNNALYLNQYIYVRELGQFDLSFVFAGDVANSDKLMVSFKTNRLPKKELRIGKSLPDLDEPRDRHISENGNVGWWYNNPSLFGYSVVADTKMPLYVCDILANCYLYERKQIDPNANYQKAIVSNLETVWNFTFPEQYKQLLSHSPLIRLYSDDRNFTIYTNTPYFSARKISLHQIQTLLKAATPKLQFVSLDTEDLSTITYQMQVPTKTQIPLAIPIGAIDLRAQKISVWIEPLKPDQYNVHLVEVKVNGNKLANTSSFSESFKYIQNSVQPWQMGNGQVKSFEIEFEVNSLTQNVDQQLVDLKIQFFVGTIERSYYDNKNPPKFGSENCHKGPTYGDLDCQYDEYQCPEYYFKYDAVKKTCTRTEEPMHQ